ncbi:hypothetical protein D3C72_1035850 [compost metagenome]
MGPQPARHVAEDLAAREPEGRAQAGHAAEDQRVAVGREQRRQAAHARAGHAGVLGAGLGAEVRVDVVLEVRDDPAHERVALAAGVEPGVAPGRQLAQAVRAAIVDAHDDHRLNFALADQPVGRQIHLPLAAERGRGVEEVLPVPHVEHGKAPAGLLVVVGRQVHRDLAVAAQNRHADGPEDAHVRLAVAVGRRPGGLVAPVGHLVTHGGRPEDRQAAVLDLEALLVHLHVGPVAAVELVLDDGAFGHLQRQLVAAGLHLGESEGAIALFPVVQAAGEVNRGAFGRGGREDLEGDGRFHAFLRIWPSDSANPIITPSYPSRW